MLSEGLVYQQEYYGYTVIVMGRPVNYATRTEGINVRAYHSVPIMQHLDASRLWVPWGTEMNAQFARTNDRWWSSSVDLIEVNYGVMADGFLIPQGDVRLCASADCPLLVLHHPKVGVVTVHCGRDAILERSHIAVFAVGGNGREREHFSAIDPAMALFNEVPRSEIYASIHAGIGWFEHDTAHETYGAYNTSLLGYVAREYGDSSVDRTRGGGAIHMPWIIRQQLTQTYSVPEENIYWDEIDTRSDSRLWSCAADDSERNGVFVYAHDMS